MRSLIVILLPLVLLLGGCVPRLETWRIDRADGTSSLVIKRNYRNPYFMLWQIDTDTARLETGVPIAIADLDYFGVAALDHRQARQAELAAGDQRGSRRSLSTDQNEFERFLVAGLATKPYPVAAHNASTFYRGWITFTAASGRVRVDVERADGVPDPAYDISGDIPCAKLTGAR